jgi:DNA-binding NarL/FixJ family response regulator
VFVEGRAINPGWTRVARSGGETAVQRVGTLSEWQREMLGDFANGSSIYDVAERREMHPRKVQRQLNEIYRALDLDRESRARPIIRAASLYSVWEERQRGVHLSDG